MRRALLLIIVGSFVALWIGLLATNGTPWFRARLAAAVTHALAERLEAEVRLDRVTVRVTPPSLDLTGLVVSARATGAPPLVTAPRARLSVDPLRLLVGRVRITRVTLTEPRIHVVIGQGLVTNLPGAGARRADRTGADGGQTADRPAVSIAGGRLLVEGAGAGRLGADLGIRRVEVLPDGRDPTATVRLALGEGRLRWRGRSASVTGLEADGQVSGRGLRLGRANLWADGLVAETSGRLDWLDAPRLDLAGVVQGPLAALGRVAGTWRTGTAVQAEGAARVAFHASGPLGAPTADVEVTASGVRVASARADRVALRARIARDRTEFGDGALEVDGVRVSVQGTLEHTAPYRFAARVSTTAAPIATLLAAAGAPAPVAPLVVGGHLDLEGRGAGLPGDGGWSLDARLAMHVTGGARGPIALTGRVEIDPDAVRLHRVAARGERPATGGDTLDAAVSGRVGLAAPHPLALRARAHLPSLQALAPLLGASAWGGPVDGAVRASGTVTGSVGAPRVAGYVWARRLAVGRYRVEQLAGRVSASRERVAVDRLALALGDTRATLTGRVDLTAPGRAGATWRDRSTVDLTLRAPQVVVEEMVRAAGLELPLSGRGRLAAHLRGPVAALSGSGSASIVQASAYGQRLDSIDVRLALRREGTLRLDHLGARVGRGRLVARAARAADGTLRGRVRAEQVPMSQIEPLVARGLPAGGTIDTTATLSGTWGAPRLVGRADLSRARYRNAPLGPSHLDLRLEWPQLAVHAALLGGAVRGDGSAALVGPRRFRLTAEFAGADIGPYVTIPGPVRLAGVVLRGHLGAAGTLHDLGATGADVRLSGLQVTAGGMRVVNDGDLALRLAGRRLSIVSAAFTAPPSRLAVTGDVDLARRALELDVTGTLDLSLARLASAYVQEGRGTVGLSARIEGPLGTPGMVGTVRVEDGRLTLGARPALTVDRLSGAVRLDGRRALVDRLTMRLGGGPASLSGVVNLSGLRPAAAELAATFDGVHVVVPGRLQGTGGGELTLTGPAEDLLLAGRLRVAEGLYKQPSGDGRKLSEETVRAAMESLKLGLLRSPPIVARLDVRLVADQVEVKGAEWDTTARADVRLVGRLPAPTALGRIDLTSGRFRVNDRVFAITTGQVDYIDPTRIAPVVLAVAETTVRDYRLQFRLTGTPEAHRLELVSPSHPGLTPLDMLTLIDRGVTMAEIRGFGGGELPEPGERSALRILGLLANASPRQLDRDARRLVGADASGVAPPPDPLLSRAQEPALTVDTQISPETRAHRSVTLVPNRDQSTRVEYWLRDDLAIVGESDDRAPVRAGVRVRVRLR